MAKRIPNMQYNISNLTYYDNAITFGAYLAFKGVSELRGRPHKISFQSNLASDCVRPGTMSPHLNLWDLTTTLELTDVARDPITNTISRRMPQAQVLQMMNEIITEQPRLDAFAEIYYKGEKPLVDFERKIAFNCSLKDRKNPYLIRTLELNDKLNSFPFLLTTEQIIFHEEFNPDADLALQEEQEDLLLKENQSYDPVGNADWGIITQNIPAHDLPIMEEGLGQIKYPSQFIAMHSFRVEELNIVDKSEERHGTFRTQNKWDIFALEKYYEQGENGTMEHFHLTPVAQVDDGKEAYQWMENLDTAIIRPNLKRVKAHEAITDMYPSHYTRYKDVLKSRDYTDIFSLS